MSYTIKPTSRAELLGAFAESEDRKADAFIKTFIGKADKQTMWHLAKGAYDASGELAGFIITTLSRQKDGKPRSANLQLMHTLHKFRGKGVGRVLVNDSIANAKAEGCTYFRVSAERTAVGFYAKCGIPFLGLQKSGTFLSLFNIEGDRSIIDDYIYDKALHRLGRVSVDRSKQPNQKEQAVIDSLGATYLFNDLMNRQTAQANDQEIQSVEQEEA